MSDPRALLTRLVTNEEDRKDGAIVRVLHHAVDQPGLESVKGQEPAVTMTQRRRLFVAMAHELDGVRRDTSTYFPSRAAGSVDRTTESLVTTDCAY